MRVEKVIGVLQDSVFQTKHVDYVDFEWHELFKKLHRKISHEKREMALRFDDSILLKGLKQDDVLAVDGDTVVAVNLLPCPVLVLMPRDHHEIAKVCYEIGNKHAPLFYGQSYDEFITPYDRTIETLMQKLHVQIRTEQAKLDFTNRISAGGVHTHSH